MTDCFLPEKRSWNMSRIPSNGNRTTEVRFAKMLRRHRISGWRRRSTLPGRPDFVFPEQMLAVFVDGDFWHGNPKKFRLPKSNVEYWQGKIARNRARDKSVTRSLRYAGWRVVRFWESALKDEETIVARLRRALHCE